MTETATPGRSRTRGTIAALLITFALGLAAMAWLLTSTEFGRDMTGTAPAPARPQALVQQPGAPAPAPALPAPAAPNDLAFRMATLEGRVASLESRPGGGAVSSAKAEGLFVVLAANRRFERGQPLAGLEPELSSRFGQSDRDAVAAVIGWSRAPVTLSQLVRSFDRQVPPSAAGNAGWWDRLTDNLSSLVVVRDRANAASAPAHLAVEAGKKLDEGDVPAAIALVAQMPKGDASTEWLTNAKRYAAARDALEKLEDRALEGSIVPTPPVKPAPPTSLEPVSEVL